MSSAPIGADEFTAAFARHGRTLWLLAAAWVGRGDAQDLVQEAARVAWQKRHEVSAGSQFGAYLAQIVRHVGANWRRKVRPTATEAQPEPFARDSVPTLRLFDADRMGLSDEVAAALQSLPAPQRAALLLHVVGELSFAEIAEMLEVNENTATSHARRARVALRAALAPLATEALRRTL
jgi:RNA polymerase sigma-70 factor (ECF subfamily)